MKVNANGKKCMPVLFFYCKTWWVNVSPLLWVTYYPIQNFYMGKFVNDTDLIHDNFKAKSVWFLRKTQPHNVSIYHRFSQNPKTTTSWGCCYLIQNKAYTLTIPYTHLVKCVPEQIESFQMGMDPMPIRGYGASDL